MREIEAVRGAPVAKVLRRAQRGGSLCAMARGAEKRRDREIEVRKVVTVVIRSAVVSEEANVAGG